MTETTPIKSTSYNYRPHLLHTSPSTTASGGAPGNRAPRFSLGSICSGLMSAPRSQFAIYVSNTMNPGRQRDVVLYSTVSKGRVRRSEGSKNRGSIIGDLYELKQQLLADIQHYQQLYYRYMSSPTYGITSASSENRSYLTGYQVLHPQPVTDIDLTR